MNKIDNSGVNKELIRQVINHIIDDPDTWNQTVWHSECGTSHCFAGWVDVIENGITSNQDTGVPNRAIKSLGIGYQLGDRLFEGDNDFETLYSICKDILEDRVDRDGRDAEGYDYDNYNCDTGEYRENVIDPTTFDKV